MTLGLIALSPVSGLPPETSPHLTRVGALKSGGYGRAPRLATYGRPTGEHPFVGVLPNPIPTSRV